MNFSSVLYSKIVPLAKKITGISDISLLRKKLKKKLGEYIYRTKYSADDIIDIMQQMGMKNGSVVCIHASMMEFYNYKGSATELIEKILQVIGPNGTLMMPAFPINNRQIGYVFDVENDKTGAGYLAETFRKYPGVQRSYNVRHSVCAIGQKADFLLQDHIGGHDCWDKKSPWYKLCELDGLVFNLGLNRTYMGTFHHCVESLLCGEYDYWSQFFDQKRIFYYKVNGIIHEYEEFSSEILRKTRKNKVLKTFTPNEWQIRRLSNLEIKVFYAKNALNKLVELGKKGITVYKIPSIKGYSFNAT